MSVLIKFTVNVYSQTKIGNTKSRSIFINKKGKIHDHGCNKIGFTKNNIVKNNKGKTIYFMDRNDNVIDPDGKNLGKAQIMF